MTEIIFDRVIPMPPVTWKRSRIADKQHFNDPKMEQAKHTLGWEVKAAAPQLRCSSTDRFGFRAAFFISGSRGGDGDRYENLVLDALQGVVWENDEQVDEGNWEKFHNSEQPRIRLTIWRFT